MAKAPSSQRVIDESKRVDSRSITRLLDPDPARVVAAFTQAEQGRVENLLLEYKGTRLLDSRLDSTAATRVLALQSRPIVWRPPPGFESDKEANEIARRVARLWSSTRQTVPFIGHMGHGALEMHAIAELDWQTDRATGWWKPALRLEQPRFVAYDPKNARAHLWIDQRLGAELESYEDKFIYYAPILGRSDNVWRRGALRACILRSSLKRLGVRGWISLLERWGQPQVVATVDDGDDDKTETIKEALRDLGIDWRAVFPKGVDVKEIAVTVDKDLHNTFVTWANGEDSIALLGQNTSTEIRDGGSFAASVVQQRVRYDILAADAAELAECLTDQWAEPVVRYNWPGAPAPYAEFVLQPKRELTVAEYQSGAFTRDQFAQSIGYEAEPDGAGKRYYRGATAKAPGPTASSPSEEPAKPSDTQEPGANKEGERDQQPPAET